MTEKVDHPPHYGGKDDVYEAIKVIEAWGLNFSLGNAVKYICRAGKKPGASALEDLRKAAWYLNHELERLQMSSNGADPGALEAPEALLPLVNLTLHDFIPSLRVGMPMVVCPLCHINTTMTRDVARWRCDRCKGVINPNDPGFDLVTKTLNPASQASKDTHEKY